VSGAVELGAAEISGRRKIKLSTNETQPDKRNAGSHFCGASGAEGRRSVSARLTEIWSFRQCRTESREMAVSYIKKFDFDINLF
jgi:hypothetical protein